MATPVLCCGFECGVASAHFAAVGGATFGTTNPRTGLRTLNHTITTSIVSSGVIGTAFNTQTVVVARFYVYFTTLPSVSCWRLFFSTLAVVQLGVWFDQTTGSIMARIGTTNSTTGVVVTTGKWYCIDLKLDVHANPWTCDVQVDGVAATQVTNGVAATTTASSGQCTFGDTSVARTENCDYEDFIGSVTTGDYPLGPGNVESFVPNADGTHTFTTTIGVRGTVAAPTGGGNIAGSTDSYLRLNARPIGGGGTDSTFLWNQQTNGATLYGEVQFEDHALPGGGANGPRAVEVLIIRRDATTGTGDSTFKLNDNGTENTIFATGAVAGVASDEFHTKQYATAPSTGAAWTLALFNGVRFRFGYSADANPDHYCRGVMIEAEFQPELGQALYARPDGLEGANLFRQLLAT